MRKTKLTWPIVRELRRLYPDQTVFQLACRFGLSKSTVWKVVSGNAWVEDPSGKEADRLTGDYLMPNYLPTPQEIAAATAEIRSTWSDREYLHRAGLVYANSPYIESGSIELGSRGKVGRGRPTPTPIAR